jgi:hypothetical protein
MIPPTNHWYRDALAGSHEAYARVEVWRAGIQVDELKWVNRSAPYDIRVPVFFGGSVRSTLNSRVTRQLSLTVPATLYPWSATDLLNPYGTELRVFKGVRYGNSSPDEFAAFTGTVEKVVPARLGTCTVSAADTALRVAGAGFPAPMPSSARSDVITEFERLVRNAYPAATFGAHSAITTKVPALSYDSDRGAALDSLAKAASANWYTLADGRFVMRTLPWLSSATITPIPLKDGHGGTLVNAYPNRSTDGVYNQVTVMSDRPDGGPALYATVSDTDASSPTYIYGPYGVRSLSVRITGASSGDQLTYLAAALLKRAKALLEPWQVECVPDASIELGDAISIAFQGHEATQFVVGFTMPLEPQGTMQLDCRDILSGGEDE